MAIEINNSGGNGQHVQNKVQGQTKPKSTPQRGFLDSFQKLPEARFRQTGNGLRVAVVRDGQGSPAANGKRLKVRYTGWLTDGTQFDSSTSRGQPFEFTLGAGRVIKGWEEGLSGIKPGERRQLVIPPGLGYGSRQVGKIPPGSTLVFNVEAVAVGESSPNPNGNLTVVA